MLLNIKHFSYSLFKILFRAISFGDITLSYHYSQNKYVKGLFLILKIFFILNNVNMTFLRIIYLIMGVGIINFYSCNVPNNNDSKSNTRELSKIETSTPDSFIRDIPKDKNGKLVEYLELIHEAESKSNFFSLENGFDSICVRIWYGYVYSDRLQVFEIKNSNSIWSSELYQLKAIYDSNTSSLLSLKKEKIETRKQPDLSTFFKEISNLKILELPDCNSISGYIFDTHSNSVIIQVSTNNKYRVYSYSSILGNVNKHWQADCMNKILQKIENDFDFKRLNKG